MLTLSDFIYCEKQVLQDYLLILAERIADENESGAIAENNIVKKRFQARLLHVEDNHQKLQIGIAVKPCGETPAALQQKTNCGFSCNTFGELNSLFVTIPEIQKRNTFLECRARQPIEKSNELLLQISPARIPIFSDFRFNPQGESVC